MKIEPLFSCLKNPSLHYPHNAAKFAPGDRINRKCSVIREMSGLHAFYSL
jgi:hypothetical protein